ncbi:MAG: phasin family protein [Gammaproteobacteria bacterium]
MKEMFDQWASISRNAIGSMQELAEINMKIVAKLSEQQQQILSTCLEASAKEMELIAGAKDPKGLLASQAQLAAEYNKKLVDIVRNTNETLMACKNDLSGWVSKSTGVGEAKPSSRPKASKR